MAAHFVYILCYKRYNLFKSIIVLKIRHFNKNLKCILNIFLVGFQVKKNTLKITEYCIFAQFFCNI